MDNGNGRYLHKKFKKQMSIEPKTKTYAADQAIRINNISVPTNSTNTNETSVNINNLCVKSSISNSKVCSSSSSNDLTLGTSSSTEDDVSNTITSEEQSGDISYVNNLSVVNHETTKLATSSILFNSKEVYTESGDSEETKPDPGSQDKANASGGKYVCTYCNLACSKPSVLQKHIRAHTNERPYPCVSCGFSFKTRSNLYKHCRSRSHANRVMGHKAREMAREIGVEADNDSKPEVTEQPVVDALMEQPVENIKEVHQEKSKPYKPRFHTTKSFYDENLENNPQDSKHQSQDMISVRINELIDENNSIVNECSFVSKRRLSHSDNHYDVVYVKDDKSVHDEPLNLSSKNRKRCLSEVSEPTIQKSLIKELLLKNLYADMQCPHCKMIFQTVTELELHKIRSCKGITKTGPRYSRSSSVNVASILTQNKNAFDNIPHLQNSVFPLKSPGPFLGKTRLVESDKTKSFSYEDCVQTTSYFPSKSDLMKTAQRYLLSPLTLSYDKIKKAPVKLFGGEVKITQTSGETKSFKIDGKDREKYSGDSSPYTEYGGGKLSENRVVKSTLQSGGTVLQSKPYSKQETLRNSPDVIRVYEAASPSPNVESGVEKRAKFHNEDTPSDAHDILVRSAKAVNSVLMNDANHQVTTSAYSKYPNIMDFSQNAVKLLAPNLKQLNLTIPGLPMPTAFIETPSPLLTVSKTFDDRHSVSPREDDGYIKSSKETDVDFRKYEHDVGREEILSRKFEHETVFRFENGARRDTHTNGKILNPMNILINGKVVRYVPGMPGPVIAETPLEQPTVITAVQKPPRVVKPNILITPVDQHKPESDPPDQPIKSETPNTTRSQPSSSPTETPRKFARPNSLALKPSMSSLKQHHGLTPTMFNQILISPDTPRGAKKYNEHFLHGNYFSYLGLKSSTKPVYCTLNKTQPFYVPHFKKLSMYSEWRQQDHKSDKLYVSGYDSRQRPGKYTVAGKYDADYVVHSSYKFTVSDVARTKEETQKQNSILGGYESNEDYTYVRGRGRGRYVCDQCGIRCKKPSMLRKHIRTHSNDRPYRCTRCNFSFKTKGNLTKHTKSKAHTKNYLTCNVSGSTAPSGGALSCGSWASSDNEDSGMDSSDDSSTMLQEHEAAYGLLSLSQKPTTTMNINQQTSSPTSSLSPISAVNVADNQTGALSSFINAEQLAHVSKTNYAKNKFLDRPRHALKLDSSANLNDGQSKEVEGSLSHYLGIGHTTTTLMYPYTSGNTEGSEVVDVVEPKQQPEHNNIIHFNVIKRYNNPQPPNSICNKPTEVTSHGEKRLMSAGVTLPTNRELVYPAEAPIVEERISHFRKRKLDETQLITPKLHKGNSEVMDLSMPPSSEKNRIRNGHMDIKEQRYYEERDLSRLKSYQSHLQVDTKFMSQQPMYDKDSSRINVNYIIQESPAVSDMPNTNTKSLEYDNSAMETLADIATKQEKLEKNSVAKNVATEFLKLATKNECLNGEDKAFVTSGKDVNELVVKSEENKSCTICSKNFSKPSQLRLHMNIHYIERPFRCEPCSTSFRTKGHLQKHERSASHHNKLSSSPALSSSEPRPFKCTDCNIAFRIHGHLAKHLRSKMHIMKLECLAKIPFGLYAELERSNSLLTEINTADGDQCLDSLKMLAKKVFINDPGKFNLLEERCADNTELSSDS